MPDTLWSFAAGALGWFAVNLMVKPWLEFLALRKEVQEELIFLSNIYPPNIGTKYEHGDEAYDAETEMFSDAQTKIRQLGSKLNAHDTLLNSSPFKPTSYLLFKLGYKIDHASKNLLRLSTQANEEDRAVARYQVETALRLPHSQEQFAKYVIKTRKRRREAAATRKRKTEADQSC